MKRKVPEQLLLFEKPKTENDCIWEAIIQLKESHKNVTRRLFGDTEDLRTSLIETKAQVERLIIHSTSQLDMFDDSLEKKSVI